MLHSDACQVLCNICPRRPRRHHSLHSITTEIDVLQRFPHTPRLIVCVHARPQCDVVAEPDDRKTGTRNLQRCTVVAPSAGLASIWALLAA